MKIHTKTLIPVSYTHLDVYKRQFLDRQYRWAQKGWIGKDAATTTDSIEVQMSNGKAFSLVSTYQPAIANAASVAYKTEMAVIPLYDAFTTSLSLIHI